MRTLKEFTEPQGLDGVIFDIQFGRRGRLLDTSAGVQYTITHLIQLQKITSSGVCLDGFPLNDPDYFRLRDSFRDQFQQISAAIDNGLPINTQSLSRYQQLVRDSQQIG